MQRLTAVKGFQQRRLLAPEHRCPKTGQQAHVLAATQRLRHPHPPHPEQQLVPPAELRLLVRERHHFLQGEPPRLSPPVEQAAVPRQQPASTTLQADGAAFGV